MPPTNTVKAAWDSFEAMVMPDDPVPNQVQEMRRSFYAGAYAMLLMCSTVGGDSVSEDEGVAMLESWRKECERFVAMINMGRA